jgi:3-hydroxyisobutyrate dehydrogenase-like beta-hydroxyacid dehydrogenase
MGLLGGALAARFLGGGLRVVGFDVNVECRRRLADAGGEPAASTPAVVAAVDVVVFSLPDSDAVETVVNEAGDRLRGRLVIDTTTGDPNRTAALGRRLADAGVRYVDATVLGSSARARAGEVVVISGGEADDVREAEEFIRLFAAEWFHVGAWGSGARMKLVANLVLGLNRAVLAEGLAFARRCGLDPGLALRVLRGGAAYSRVMDEKGRKMVEADFGPEARLSQHLKDVRLILAAGRKAGAVLPLSELHERLLAGLERAGYGGSDNSAVIRAFDPGPEA